MFRACRENLSFQTHRADQQRQEEQVQAGSSEQEGEMGFLLFLQRREESPSLILLAGNKEACLKIKVLLPMSSSHQLLGLVT